MQILIVSPTNSGEIGRKSRSYLNIVCLNGQEINGKQFVEMRLSVGGQDAGNPLYSTYPKDARRFVLFVLWSYCNVHNGFNKKHPLLHWRVFAERAANTPASIH